jgi:hypothetical protein
VKDSRKDLDFQSLKTLKPSTAGGLEVSPVMYRVGAVAGGLSFLVNAIDGVRRVIAHDPHAVTAFCFALSSLAIVVLMWKQLRKLKKV